MLTGTRCFFFRARDRKRSHAGPPLAVAPPPTSASAPLPTSPAFPDVPPQTSNSPYRSCPSPLSQKWYCCFCSQSTERLSARAARKVRRCSSSRRIKHCGKLAGARPMSARGRLLLEEVLRIRPSADVRKREALKCLKGGGGCKGGGGTHLMKRAYSGRRQYCRYSKYSAKAGRSSTFACARSIPQRSSARAP